MDLGIEGKCAVVCAASKGLGRAIAEALAREKAKVLICARGEKDLKAAAESMGARWLAVDMTKEHDRKKLVDEALKTLGGVDILVNNSGGPPVGPFESFSLGAWRDAFELNFLSFVHLTQLVLPEMKEKGWGRIVNMASYAALEAIPGLMLSHGIRPSVLAWTRALAREVARNNIGVVSVCPGLFYTDRVKQIIRARSDREGRSQEEILKGWAEEIPLGRMGDPPEIGNLVAFLASPAANYITGSAVVIDGGIMRRLI
ncbi:MAG: SDR family oxidoreductase [Pseudomonadota bacterium]